MKKYLSLLLVCVLLFSCTWARSDPMTIDLSTMTIEEMDQLTEQINTEKKKATEVSADVKRFLESDFMRAVEEINPQGTTFSYPFFGLSVVHRRYYYCVCGTVGCHFPDKTNKDLWDATLIYWLDEETNTFSRAAFYSRDELFFVDPHALSHVVRYAEKVALENLERHHVSVNDLESRSLPNTEELASVSASKHTVIVFTIEYILRIWTADLLYPNEKHPRLKYIFSFMAIIDLCAILPFFVPFISVDLRFLRMIRLLRLFRLLRVFKLGRYFDALTIVVDVIKGSASQLVVSVILCFFIMLFAAIIMYTAENPVQPEQFPNIIASLWWAICTLTTVGYGDVYPITVLGRFFASIISIVGIGIIAIPTGIIAAGFTSAINKKVPAEEEKKNFCPYCGHKLE